MNGKFIKITVALSAIVALLSGCSGVDPYEPILLQDGGLDDSKLYSETSVSSEPIIYTRADQVVDEFLDLIAEEKNNKEKSHIKFRSTAYEEGETLLCTIGNYELHIKKEESYLGDSTSFGVFDKMSKHWTVPYTENSKLLTSGIIGIDEIMWYPNQHLNEFDGFLGSTLSCSKSGIILCNDYFSNRKKGYLWVYDFLNDRFAYATSSDFDYKYLYHTDDYVAVYDRSSIRRLFWDSDKNETKVSGFLCAVKHGVALHTYSYSDERCLLSDYDGNILLDLSDYDVSSYASSANTDYNGNQLLTVLNGKESGIYLALINSDGTLGFDPIKLYCPDHTIEFNLVYFLSDSFVLVRRTGMDPDMGSYFYELDGTEITRTEDIFGL